MSKPASSIDVIVRARPGRFGWDADGRLVEKSTYANAKPTRP